MQTSKVSYKQYKCTRCGNVSSIQTNHYGETYGPCKACNWKNPMKGNPTHECIEPLPEGWTKPPKWEGIFDTKQPKDNPMATEVDSITIPGEFKTLADQWYGGQHCILYAISSTGGLTLGTIRPTHDMSDQEWYVSLWDDLDITLSRILRKLESDHEDKETLTRFQEFAEQTADRLREEYGLDD